MDVFRRLESGALADPRIQVVFADPPYDSDDAARLLAHLRGKSYDNLELIVLEHRDSVDAVPLNEMQYAKTKRFGESRLTFWERK